MSDKSRHDTKTPPEGALDVQSDVTAAIRDVAQAAIMEAVKSEQPPPLNVNVLFQAATPQAPQALAAAVKAVTETQLAYEGKHLENTRAFGDMVIDFKTRDPDEIEKRANSRGRRITRHVLLALGIFSLASGVLCTIKGCPLVVNCVLFAVGALLAVLPALGTDSFSADDVVKLGSVFGSYIPKVNPPEVTGKSVHNNRKGRRK
jgi:hypothetical protein